MDGQDLIARERDRQQSVEGYSAEHDDEHDHGELARAGRCYRRTFLPTPTPPRTWPWETPDWKPGTRIRNLVKAGALYQAEIDRLIRARDEIAKEIDGLIES